MNHRATPTAVLSVMIVSDFWQDGRVTRNIDGSGDYACEIAAGQYAFLATFDPQIWGLCYDVLLSSNRVDITASHFQEDWWGATMLGIARLARFAPPGLPATATDGIGAHN